MFVFGIFESVEKKNIEWICCNNKLYSNYCPDCGKANSDIGYAAIPKQIAIPAQIAQKKKKKGKIKMKFNPFHFWTKNYEWDLLAPAREIIGDIKKMKKIKEREKNKKTCHNYNCPNNKFSICYSAKCPDGFSQN